LLAEKALGGGAAELPSGGSVHAFTDLRCIVRHLEASLVQSKLLGGERPGFHDLVLLAGSPAFLSVPEGLAPWVPEILPALGACVVSSMTPSYNAAISACGKGKQSKAFVMVKSARPSSA